MRHLLRVTTFWALLTFILSSCREVTESAEELGEELGERYLVEKGDEELPVGWTSVTHLKMEGKNLPTEVKIGARRLEGVANTERTFQMVLQILGKDKSRVTIQKEEEVYEVRVGALSKLPVRTTGVLVGRHIIQEKKDGVLSLRFESGDPPTARQSEVLEERRASLQEITVTSGDTYRRIGEKWEEESALFGKGVIQYRFDRVEIYQGQQCAVFVGTIEILEKGPDGSQTKITGSVRDFRSLVVYHSLYQEVIGSLEMTSYPEVGKTVTMRGPVKMTSTVVVTVPEFH